VTTEALILGSKQAIWLLLLLLLLLGFVMLGW
jgi:hypothetical protein